MNQFHILTPSVALSRCRFSLQSENRRMLLDPTALSNSPISRSLDSRTYSFFAAAAANNSSASLFFVPLTSLSPNFALSPLSPALTLALAAPFKRSESSFLKSSDLLLLAAGSSSSSPRAKGSLSSSGLGATEVRGCHFLPLLERSDASTSSTGPP